MADKTGIWGSGVPAGGGLARGGHSDLIVISSLIRKPLL